MGMTKSLRDLPVELGTLVVSHLSFKELLVLRGVCRDFSRRLPNWAPSSLLVLPDLSVLTAVAFEELLQIMAWRALKVAPTSPPWRSAHTLVQVGARGRILVHVELACTIKLESSMANSMPWRSSGMRLTLKSLYIATLSLDAAIALVIDSDPYSFRILGPLFKRRDSVLGTEASIAARPFSASLKASLRGDRPVGPDVSLVDDAPREYKQSLYPLSRSDPSVWKHIHDLFLQGATLESIVDGTVGMIPDFCPEAGDLAFEPEPPHWQTLALLLSHRSADPGYGKPYRIEIELQGRELPLTFSTPRPAWAFLETLSRRWKDLYSSV